MLHFDYRRSVVSARAALWPVTSMLVFALAACTSVVPVAGAPGGGESTPDTSGSGGQNDAGAGTPDIAVEDTFGPGPGADIAEGTDGVADTVSPDVALDDIGGQDTEAPDTQAPDANTDDLGMTDAVDVSAGGPGAACSKGADCIAGFCVDGVCCHTACDTECVACSTALTGLAEGSCGPVAAGTDPHGTCPDDGAPSCGRTGTCNGLGACSFYTSAAQCEPPSCTDGTKHLPGACDGKGECTEGATESCGVYQCVGSACADQCASDAGCAGETWCELTTGKCVPKKEAGATCQTGKGGQCGTGFCVDGVCCDIACDGPCQACTAALTGLETDGTCGPASSDSDPDSECADQGAASCGTNGFCDGNGGCALYPAPVECAASTCGGGVQTLPRVCDGAGACVDHGTSACAPYVCAGTACANSCTSDAGCVAGAYCEGGVCVGANGGGTACQSAASCASGFCVDGFCCDSTCKEGCSACSAALTDAANGVCAPVTSGTDPDGDCADQGATSCGTTGLCAADATCALYESGTSCQPGSCASGTQTAPGSCSGNGACEPGPVSPCAPYTCGTTQCKPSCDVDADCAAGSYCKLGLCQPKELPGITCTGANQCATGSCVDGVCCDSPCGGLCQACTAARKGSGSDGTCGPVASGADPDTECVDAGASSCGTDGACDGTGACRRYTASTPCAAAVCSSGKATEASTCDGQGTCMPGPQSTCAPFLCGDGICRSSCSGDADCTSGNYCAGGVCKPQSGNGSACSVASQCPSGNCVDGVCCDTPCAGSCRACSATRKGGGVDGVCGDIVQGLDPDNECTDQGAAACGTDGTCNGTGACRLYASTTVCAAAACASGTQTLAGKCTGTGQCAAGATSACAPYLCGATSCKTTCSADTDCAANAYCGGGLCVLKVTGGAACTQPNQCGSGFCVDGVCCDGACTGACRACSAVKKGSGQNGVCGLIAVATDPDAECADQGATSCGTDGMCDGAGACRKYASGTVCTSASCATGSQTVAATCNGTGLCVAGATSPCSPYQCGASACKTTCSVDADCVSGSFCSGGQCAGKAGNGGMCTLASQCASGSCVDGVCCNAPCAGLCQACSAAKKGSGADGVCGSIAVATDPDGECADQLATTCGTDGTCDGAGVCRKYVSGTTCAPGSCSVATQVASSTCNGIGTCSAGVSTSCSPYVCGGTACKSTCAADGDCASGFYCKASLCVPKLTNGAVCTIATTCASGACVDGVCCNTTCVGLCQACSAARKGSGSDGACGTVGAATDPDSECSDQGATSCGTNGFCDGAGACKKYSSGTVCSAASCASGLQVTASTCDGVGTCKAGTSTNCSPYLCGTTGACRTSCAADVDCIPGDYCASGGICKPRAGGGTSCSANNQCVSLSCVDGVCCSSSCAAGCEACVAAKTGSPDGLCAPISANTDPDSECTDQGASSCGSNGFCNGTGACARYAVGTTCSAATCSSGSQTSAGACNTSGSCGGAATSACAPYVCGSAACASSCLADSGCTSTYYCSSGACVAKKSVGTACTSNNQCGSGACVDGVCCGSACTGGCQACNAAKTGAPDGQCASIPSGSDPDNECIDQGASSCLADGTCNGNGGCRLYASGTVCVGPSCVNGSQTTASLCNGLGACKPGTTGACTPYICGSNACVTSCTLSSECVAGNLCINNVCQPQLPQGSVCTAASECATGFCIDGYCCNSACTGLCNSCDGLVNQSGTNGTCDIINDFEPCGLGKVCCNGACLLSTKCILQ